MKNELLTFAILDDKPDEINKMAKLVNQFPNTAVVRKLRDEEQLLNYLNSTKNLPNFLIADIKIGIDYKEGYRIAEEVTKKFKSINIILVSEYPDTNYLKDVIAKGIAKGFVNKERLASNLPKAITKIINGEEYWTDLPKNSYLNNAKYVQRENKKRFLAERKYLGLPKDYEEQELNAYKTQCNIQLDYELTVHQWIIFKFFAKGYSAENIAINLNSTKESVNVQKVQIKRLFDFNDKNKSSDVWFMIKALELGVVEIREFLEKETGINIIK